MDLAGGVCSYTAYNIIRSVVLEVDKEARVSLSDDGRIKVAHGICCIIIPLKGIENGTFEKGGQLGFERLSGPKTADSASSFCA
jgi:hypothetical protein